MISIPSDNLIPVTHSTVQEDTSRTFNVCNLPVIATITPSFHLPSDSRPWNCLPVDITTTDDFHKFELKLQQHVVVVT